MQFAPSQIGAPVFPHDLSSQPASFVIRPNITTIDPNIEASYSEQVNAQVEHEFTGNTILSVGYLHLRGLHLMLSRNIMSQQRRPVLEFQTSGDPIRNGATPRAMKAQGILSMTAWRITKPPTSQLG
jgi:hypothetical protein